MKKLKKILVTLILTAISILAFSTISNSATTLKVTGDTLNIRKGPSTESQVIAMLFKGVECELLEDSGEWYKIKYKTYTGYVSKQYVEVVGNDTSDSVKNNEDNNTENTVKVDEKNNLTGTASNETNNIDNVKNETLQEKNSNNEKYENEETNQLIYKKLKQDVSVKILPLIYSSNIETIKKNKNVILLSEVLGWSYIQTDLNCGWVRSEFLETSKTVTVSNDNEKDIQTDTNINTEKTVYINESLVNMRKGAGTSYNIIKVLSLNTELTVVDDDGEWYNVKHGTTTGYVLKKYVSDTKTTTTRSNNSSRTESTSSVNSVNIASNVEEEKVSATTVASNDKKNTTTTTSSDKENTVNTTSTKTDKIKGTDVVAYAKKYLGYKYVYGGDGSDGTFDCSGFTMYVYKHFGINIPHGANAQYYRSGKGKQITKYSDLQVGDIVFLTDYETGIGIGHCGIYLGNDNFIHASTTCYAVEISSFKTIYEGRFYSGLRLI